MSTAYDSIMQGLNEALDHAQGKEAGARVHAIEVPVVDVAAIRSSCTHTKRREGKEFIVRVFRDEGLVRIWRTK